MAQTENFHNTSVYDTAARDQDALASLGYKQEFKREFTMVELFGFGFSISSVVPSAACVLFTQLI